MTADPSLNPDNPEGQPPDPPADPNPLQELQSALHERKVELLQPPPRRSTRTLLTSLFLRLTAVVLILIGCWFFIWTLMALFINEHPDASLVILIPGHLILLSPSMPPAALGGIIVAAFWSVAFLLLKLNFHVRHSPNPQSTP
jgi:hypothetical protein